MPAQAGVQESQAEISDQSPWIPAFAGLTAPHSEPQTQFPSLQPAQGRAGFARRNRALAVGIGLLLVTGITVTVWYLFPPFLSPQHSTLNAEHPAPNTQAALAALPLPDKPSIIVLPFVNLSGDPSQEYFSDGMTEEITAALSRISRLFVIARTSAFTYKGNPTKVQDISREMGVRYVLEGSARKVDEQVRIIAQLIDATAMYRAKAQGGGRYQIFDTAMYASALALLQLEADMKRAVENHEWQVYYQPIISMVNGKATGVEALVRWMHPTRGMVPPLEFISVAEETGLILPSGEYVLRTACAQIKAWRDAGHSNLWVSVNLSGRQFQDQNLLTIIEQTLIGTGLPSDGLRLEITESVAMKDITHSIRVLKQLDQLGVHVSLDDFGNGYSSLGYLKRFPLKVLKIDRSFIQDIEVNKNSEAITTAIISMAHTLNLEVIAEGVETVEQLAFLRSLACDDVQGFLFSRPLPAGQLDQMLQREHFMITPEKE